MGPPRLSTCNHAGIRFVAQHSSASTEHPWEIAQLCGDERCGAVKGAVLREPDRNAARKTALRLAQEKADAIGRLVEVRVLAEPGKRWVGYYLARPKSQTTGLVQLLNIGPSWRVCLVVLGSSAPVFILWQLQSPEAGEAGWASGIITALTVMSSIVIAASMTVASRLATDHAGPWAARRDILTRATGLAILGTIVLSMAFLAAFLPYLFVRYTAFATSITVILLMVPELVQTPRRLVSYATEARRNNPSS